MQRIGIIGPGRVGGALAIALARAGFEITTVIGRNTLPGAEVLGEIPGTPVIAGLGDDPRVDADVVLITTGDPEIRTAAEWVAKSASGTPVVLHTSGSLNSSELEACSSAGFPVGSIHPLVSISGPATGSLRFAGAYFCIEGDDAAAAAARTIVSRLGGSDFTVPTRLKPLYHAAAVMSAGHVVALFSMAAETLAKCGVADEEAEKILVPLAASTIENLRTNPPGEALTGSFARMDIAAFERHIAAMRGNVSDQVLRMYLLLGERSLDLAAKNGRDPDRVREFRDQIHIAQSSIE